MYFRVRSGDSNFRQGSTPSSSKYTKRTNRYEVVVSYGDTKSVHSWTADDQSPKQVNIRSDSRQFRYMFQKMQDRAHGTAMHFCVMFLLIYMTVLDESPRFPVCSY